MGKKLQIDIVDGVDVREVLFDGALYITVAEEGVLVKYKFQPWNKEIVGHA